MVQLRISTDPQWTQVVLNDFDAFLIDHAACERKASALGLSLLAHYPDKAELVREMVDFAQEELQHFAQVMALLRERGLVLREDKRDPYVRALMKLIRNGRHEYFLDRLLVAGIVEARGCERFAMVAEALPEGTLKEFYQDITRAEARHHGLFIRLAKVYFSLAEVNERLDTLLDAEANIVKHLEHRAALH